MGLVYAKRKILVGGAVHNGVFLLLIVGVKSLEGGKKLCSLCTVYVANCSPFLGGPLDLFFFRIFLRFIPEIAMYIL